MGTQSLGGTPSWRATTLAGMLARLPAGAADGLAVLGVLAAVGFGTGQVVRKEGLSLIPNALVGATVGS